MSYFATEEVSGVQSWLIYDHGNALCLKPFHNTLNRRLTEVVGTGFHGQAVDADNRIANIFNPVKNFVGDKVFTGTVSIHNCLDQILRNLVIVGEQLLGVLWQAVTAVSEAWIVVTVADARIKANAVNDFASVQSAAFSISVKLIEMALLDQG